MVITIWKLRPCFQGSIVVINKNYPVCKLLKNLDLERRMILLSTELLEYDIHFLLRGNIKSQVLANFLVEFISITSDEFLHVKILSIDNAYNMKGSGENLYWMVYGSSSWDILQGSSLRLEKFRRSMRLWL